MITIAPIFVEFRCDHCWVSNCADSETIGSEVDCRNCGQPITVPEATEDRIARALALLEAEPEVLATKKAAKTNVGELDRQYSENELIDIARRESFVPLNQMDFQGYPPASIVARLIANILDNVLLATALVFGVFFVLWMAKLGLVVNPIDKLRNKEEIGLASLLPMVLIPALLVICQWILLSISGQTIGKKLLMIRIVSESGKLPGFIQAVLLRNWLRVALSFIPFFGLIDLLFIFSASRKCLHDHIAGTRVVTLV